MSGYKFTFVIGFRYKADRISLLRRTLDWVNTFKDVEVILVEQDKHSKIYFQSYAWSSRQSKNSSKLYFS